MRTSIVLTAALVATVLAGCGTSSDEAPRSGELQPAVRSSSTEASNDEAPDPPRSVEPADCPPNASCLPTFVLDGVEYGLASTCDSVTADVIGEPLDIAEPTTGGQRVPQTIYQLERFAVSAGVAVDWACGQQALAMPTQQPDGATAALARARLRCEALAEPGPQRRCDDGGDARWRTGDGWYEYAFAPFPEAVDEADAAIDGGHRRWRADPREVATRRYEAEGVCTDADRKPCPLHADLTAADERAVVQGTVQPFPHVTWDITIVVERLGQDSWWTTAMTIEPRDGPS